MRHTLAGLAVGLGVGFVAGGGWSAAPPPSPEPTIAAPVRARSAPAARRPEAQPDSCADELELARDTIADLETELYGAPVPWTDDIPGTHRPEAVQARIRQAFQDCAVSGDLVGFDCDEAPCFAIVDATGGDDVYGSLVGCPTWSDAWGSGTSMSSRTVSCGEEDDRRLLFVSPGTRRHGDEEIVVSKRSTPDEKAELENGAKRHQARAEAAASALCAPRR